ncbi:hypothetical protein SAMN05421767_12426 [Granulicatella balaenopterae]|uniref:histidine kinase n=1 Tax=Granulicatella balaenopterae TaxID=137733 RepID=A0A1H9M6N5_9LACT|nr:HAMP domain-containing sensor histidine kinase [Granulicatella balaenopterae]SER19366.1 hypothetical protein SAMN05421767_12426 [Granulicatella balaenopterae]
MKYFYQQLLACLSIVLITILLCGGLVYNFTIDSIYSNLSHKLSGYAETIINQNLDVATVEQNLNILEDNTIQIAQFDQYNIMTYPKTNYAFKSNLTDKEIRQMKDGDIIAMKQVKQNFDGQEKELVLIYYPIFKQQKYTGFIAIGSPLSQLQHQLTDLQNSILVAFGIASVFGILVSFVFARYQTKRIEQLRKATQQIADGNFDVSVPHATKDEIDYLAVSFNQMANSLRKSEQEIERQETLRRQLLMDVAHEMRTPLTTMNGLLEGLLYDMIPEDKKARSLDLICKETQRLTRLVNENLDYEKIRANEIVLVKQEIPVKPALQNVVLQLQELADKKDDQLVIHCEDDFTIYADYDRFIQIVVNLVKNAIQFTDHGTITLKTWSDKNNDILAIHDTGIGIEADKIDAIWERFYKADISRKSTKYGESGIGLAIVKSLVTSHGGDISVHSQKGKGTSFIIKFPKHICENKKGEL